MWQGARTRRIPQSADAVTPTLEQHRVHRLGADEFAGRRVHLIGIGGSGMRGAAAILLRRRAIVSGSDTHRSDETLRLEKSGVSVSMGQRAENLAPDVHLVVYSAAIKPDNPELMEARRRGLETIKYAELLGRLMRGREGIAVAGTHGKSTTTAMTAFILQRAGLDPSFVVGARVEQLGGGSGVGDGAHFVVEACEFDRSFLHLEPKYAAILNVEDDHLDYYKNGLDEIVGAFSAFAGLVPSDGVLVVNKENRAATTAAQNAIGTVETFGLVTGATWQALGCEAKRGCYRFQIARNGNVVGETRLQIAGLHHVANALAATALCFHSGVPIDAILRILPEFRGVQRRLTLRGQINGITVLDDYGHHPTEIQATLRAARDQYQAKRLWVVFQPHQHSRTRFLLADFARSFGSADIVIVPDIYFVRDSESERERVTARDLVERIHLNGGDARYEPAFDRIVGELARSVKPGDVVLTMGAGDVWRVADGLVSELTGCDPVGEFVPFGGHALLNLRDLRDVG